MLYPLKIINLMFIKNSKFRTSSHLASLFHIGYHYNVAKFDSKFRNIPETLDQMEYLKQQLNGFVLQKGNKKTKPVHFLHSSTVAAFLCHF